MSQVGTPPRDDSDDEFLLDLDTPGASRSIRPRLSLLEESEFFQAATTETHNKAIEDDSDYEIDLQAFTVDVVNDLAKRADTQLIPLRNAITRIVDEQLRRRDHTVFGVPSLRGGLQAHR